MSERCVCVRFGSLLSTWCYDSKFEECQSNLSDLIIARDNRWSISEKCDLIGGIFLEIVFKDCPFITLVIVTCFASVPI